jgi:hypothetical protein
MHEQVAKCSASGPESRPTDLGQDQLAAWNETAQERPTRIPLHAMLTGADTRSRFPSAGPPFKVVNNYGPAEYTGVATSSTVPARGDAGGQPCR